VHLLQDLVDSWFDRENESLTCPKFYSAGGKDEADTLVAVAYLSAGTTHAVEYIQELLHRLPDYKEEMKSMSTNSGRCASIMCHSPFMTERMEKSIGMMSEILNKCRKSK
jgi:hypothetical protein